MHTLFTIGYTGRKPEELKALADEGKLILDVRLSPNSRVPRWRQEALRNLLAGLYMHRPELGNVNYKNGGPVKLADPQHSVL